MLFQLKVDSHVHTINSVHAYSTLRECSREAKNKKLECIVVTDHFGPFFLNGSLFQSFAGIANITRASKLDEGVRILSGVEIDIVNKKGDLAFFDKNFFFDKSKSVGEKLCDSVNIVIASYHDIYGDLTFSENTTMLSKVLRHPAVNILGHCDRIKGGFDLDKILSIAKAEGKIIELNCSSLSSGLKAEQKIKKLASACMQKKVLVSIGSDAHIDYEIGNFDQMRRILTSINFPKELIVTENILTFSKYLRIK